jgi:hypothetical protein
MDTKERLAHAMSSTANALAKEAASTGGPKPTPGRLETTLVEQLIAEWPGTPQKVTRRMIEKYGAPNEAMPSRLIWFGTGPWKRTVVYRDETPHNFPKPHTDLLEQVIDFRVPIEKVRDVVAFDGSMVFDRTKGELSVTCDMEEMNFLAMNLAHEVATGRRTVEEARTLYAETATGFMMGRPAPYTEGLQFTPPDGGTNDVDETTIAAAMLNQTAEKVKDVFRRAS